MKKYVALLVVFGTLVGARTSPVDESPNKIWPIPQNDGTTRWMTRAQATLEAMLTEPLAVGSPRKLDKVRFFLYTQSNPTEPFEIDMADPDSLSRSNFNRNNPTRFFVHGWNGGYLAEQNTKLREGLLLNGENRQFNFFAVDWSVYGQTVNYISAQSSCSKAGEIVAEFIDWLNTAANLPFDTLTLYGHSLGAHVVGFAGKKVSRGKVDTIIGLDAAMPLFDYNNPASRLADNDARYVESIHTNGGLKGFYNPIGQAAFYPNGGKSQPGCGIDLDGTCAHERAVDYLAEALRLNANNGFNTLGCSQFNDVKDKDCKLYSGGVRMGEPSNSNNAGGVYFLTTNSNSPFGVAN